jgi:hypothetical protein
MLLHTRSHVGYVVLLLWYFLGCCDDKLSEEFEEN